MRTLFLLVLFSGQAIAGVPYWQTVASTTTGTATAYLAGTMKVYPSTTTAAASQTITLAGPTGTVTATTFAGNVTGNASGSASSITGMIASSQVAAGVLNSVTSLTASSATINGAAYLTGNVGIGMLPALPLDISGAQGRIRMTSTTGTLRSGIQMVNTGGSSILGLEGSAGGEWQTGTSPYSMVIAQAGAYPIHFTESDSIRMTIFNGGNVGIGTTGPSYKLEVSSGVIYNGGSGAGITTTGDVTAVTFHGSGSELTGLPGGGDAVLSATQTWTGQNTFSGTTSTTTFSGWIDIGYEKVEKTCSATSCRVSCSAGKRVMGCGVKDSGAGILSLGNDAAVTPEDCVAVIGASESFTVQAYCARVK